MAKKYPYPAFDFIIIMFCNILDDKKHIDEVNARQVDELLCYMTRLEEIFDSEREDIKKQCIDSIKKQHPELSKALSSEPHIDSNFCSRDWYEEKKKEFLESNNSDKLVRFPLKPIVPLTKNEFPGHKNYFPKKKKKN